MQSMRHNIFVHHPKLANGESKDLTDQTKEPSHKAMQPPAIHVLKRSKSATTYFLKFDDSTWIERGDDGSWVYAK